LINTLLLFGISGLLGLLAVSETGVQLCGVLKNVKNLATRSPHYDMAAVFDNLRFRLNLTLWDFGCSRRHR
jgi:hypothetical protein